MREGRVLFPLDWVAGVDGHTNLSWRPLIWKRMTASSGPGFTPQKVRNVSIGWGANAYFEMCCLAAQAIHRNRESSAQVQAAFRVAEFTEVVLQSAAYSLSVRAPQFPFLVVSHSGSQTLFRQRFLPSLLTASPPLQSPNRPTFGAFPFSRLSPVSGLTPRPAPGNSLRRLFSPVLRPELGIG